MLQIIIYYLRCGKVLKGVNKDDPGDGKYRWGRRHARKIEERKREKKVVSIFDSLNIDLS